MSEQDHMRIDIEANTSRVKDLVDIQITEYAEQNAEVYVSSTLGMEEGEEKQAKKNEYIDNFISKLKQIL